MIRLSLGAVLVITATLPSISAQGSGRIESLEGSSPTDSLPPCQSFRSDASASMQVLSSFVPETAYVDMPIEQLRKMVPLLNPTMTQRTHEVDDTSAPTPSPDSAEFILSKTGAAITELLRTTPNLTANEKVRLTGENLNSSRFLVNGVFVTPQAKWFDTRDYDYRIVHRQKPSGGDVLVEFRTDARGLPIDNSAKNPYRPMNVGFATVWLVFLPGNLHESRFRYLGEQSIGGRKTYALAFAQNRESTGMQPVINYGSGQCTAPLQGVAWIDQSSFRIVRIQTDLLYSLPDIQLSQLRSILTYQSVKIAGLHISLSLPRDVEITWKTTFRNAKESHHYSDYKLFQVTMKLLPGFELQQK